MWRKPYYECDCAPGSTSRRPSIGVLPILLVVVAEGAWRFLRERRRGSRGCQCRTRLRKWLPFYVLSLARGHWRTSPAGWCFATFRPQPLQNLRKSNVFSYPPSGSAPALSGTHARARSNVYQDISQGMLGGLTRRGGLRSQRGGLGVSR